MFWLGWFKAIRSVVLPAARPAKGDLPMWLVSRVEHEGYPMGLRVRPGVATDANRAAFPHLILIHHHLERVRSDGLPEKDYNSSLLEFDGQILRIINGRHEGIVALVETFAGKRTYYAYVDANATFKARFAEVQSQYPEHRLSFVHREEPDWETYRLYQKLFPW